MEPLALLPKEVANLLQMCETTLRRLTAEGKIPYNRFLKRYPYEALKEFVNQYGNEEKRRTMGSSVTEEELSTDHSLRSKRRRCRPKT